MARRHIMTLRVGDEIVEVETNPEMPAGYNVSVTRYIYGGARVVVFDQVRNSTKEAAALFAEKCREAVDEMATRPTVGVNMRPSQVYPIRPDDEGHRSDTDDRQDFQFGLGEVR